jgi:hypothetical protein
MLKYSSLLIECVLLNSCLVFVSSRGAGGVRAFLLRSLVGPAPKNEVAGDPRLLRRQQKGERRGERAGGTDGGSRVRACGVH